MCAVNWVFWSNFFLSFPHQTDRCSSYVNGLNKNIFFHFHKVRQQKKLFSKRNQFQSFSSLWHGKRLQKDNTREIAIFFLCNAYHTKKEICKPFFFISKSEQRYLFLFSGLLYNRMDSFFFLPLISWLRWPF